MLNTGSAATLGRRGCFYVLQGTRIPNTRLAAALGRGDLLLFVAKGGKGRKARRKEVFCFFKSDSPMHTSVGHFHCFSLQISPQISPQISLQNSPQNSPQKNGYPRASPQTSPQTSPQNSPQILLDFSKDFCGEFCGEICGEVCGDLSFL
jgi:hypothetical protein